ncbi:MAG: nucleotidyl transferase AbiEii/AbiGii toxin family protein [Candidatus Diapherotrites archaeon]
MLSRNELARYGPPGFHLAQKEKDYVQHWVLSFLSQSGFGGVFKGGTCLQKAFGLPRYSEDLDFTLNGADEPDFEAISAYLSSAGLSGMRWKKESTEISGSAKLRFRGPLYNGSEISEGSIIMEFSKRETAMLKARAVIVTPPYPDMLPYSVMAMEKDEIAAEKMRAILTRNSARDLFDLYFLFHGGAHITTAAVNRKLEYYGLKFSYAEFGKRVARLEKIWKREISALTPSPVDYGIAAKLVLKEAKVRM